MYSAYANPQYMYTKHSFVYMFSGRVHRVDISMFRPGAPFWMPYPRDILVRPVPRRPDANPEDPQHILDNTEAIVGFYGASSIERFPTEVGIKEQAEQFKAVTFKQ